MKIKKKRELFDESRTNKYSKKSLDVTIVDLDKPKPNANEVLIKVHYAGVNPLDNMITRGEVKMILPYKVPIAAGHEFSGVVEEIGSRVKNIKVGDNVYGKNPFDKPGAFAEYLVLPEIDIATIPENLSLEEAATIPLTGLTAIQALEKLGACRGGTLFISGASESFGSLAIPIAKSKGLRVIATGNARNKQRLLDLGLDEFIDYKTQDYKELVSNVDYVIDTLGGDELINQFAILKPGGSLVTLKGMPNKAFAKTMLLSPFKQFLFGLVGRKYDALAAKNNQSYDFIFVMSNGKQLAEITQIYTNKPFATAIDGIYELKDINQALNAVDTKSSRGKTLIKLID